VTGQASFAIDPHEIAAAISVREGDRAAGGAAAQPDAGMALANVERKFEDAALQFILNDDHAALGRSASEGLACSDLLTSPRRFLRCLNVAGQFDALLINYGQLTTANMKVVARHSKGPPRSQRWPRLVDPFCTEFRVCCDAKIGKLIG
jgi:hypothetical protein